MPLKVPSALCCMNETVKYRRGAAQRQRYRKDYGAEGQRGGHD